jgi:hypothetical protein
VESHYVTMFGSVQTEARLLEVGSYIALRVALKKRPFRRPEARFFRSANDWAVCLMDGGSLTIIFQLWVALITQVTANEKQSGLSM